MGVRSDGDAGAMLATKAGRCYLYGVIADGKTGEDVIAPLVSSDGANDLRSNVGDCDGSGWNYGAGCVCDVAGDLSERGLCTHCCTQARQHQRYQEQEHSFEISRHMNILCIFGFCLRGGLGCLRPRRHLGLGAPFALTVNTELIADQVGHTGKTIVKKRRFPDADEITQANRLFRAAL